MNRRGFIQQSFLAATVFAAARFEGFGAEPSTWPIGCFNRPWIQWSYDEALDGIVEAGYQWTGLLSTHRGEAFTSAAATPEYLAQLKKRIHARGLKVNMTAIRFKPEAPLDELIGNVRKQIENAARMELQYLLTFGVDKPAHYEKFYRLMSDAAVQAEKRFLRLVMKPHGGGSGASEEILRCIEKVGQPNFKIWYDAGDIIYYTGKDPVTELEPIAKYVTGFCAKDCPEPKGQVMSQFGSGKVDFKAVFSKLKAAGFDGPIMVEGVKVGSTPAETTRNARENREFLERTLRSIS